MKNQHRLLFSIIILLITSLLLLGCDKKDDDRDEDNPLLSSAPPTLVGTWTFVKAEMTLDGRTETVTAEQMGMSQDITFNQDGTASWTIQANGESQSGTGTWSTDGDQLTSVSLDGTVETMTYNLNGNELTVSSTVNDMPMKLYYERKS